MHTFALIGGILLVLSVIWEVFETLILPRRVQRKVRITRYFYGLSWTPWRRTAAAIKKKNRRELFLAIYGPASLLLLFSIWACVQVVAYGLIVWGLRSPLGINTNVHPSLASDIYLSASTYFTLGLGDVVPHSGPSRLITVVEAGNGLAFFAIVISYLPTLYSSFSRREVNISLLDARAGSPATGGELLRRYAAAGALKDVEPLLAVWEIWAAELMESHISYPALCYFRSQHSNQSWVAAVTSILDTCSLILTGADGISRWQAQLTFAVARHALVDIAQILSRAPTEDSADRLPPAAFERMRSALSEAGVQVGASSDACSLLRELRSQYEPYAFALSEFLAMPLPPWSRPEGSKDNWTTSAWKLIH